MTAVATNLEEVVEQPLGRVPYITVRAFCETAACTSTITQAAADRRLSRADVTISVGGLRGAVHRLARWRHAGNRENWRNGNHRHHPGGMAGFHVAADR